MCAISYYLGSLNGISILIYHLWCTDNREGKVAIRSIKFLRKKSTVCWATRFDVRQWCISVFLFWPLAAAVRLVSNRRYLLSPGKPSNPPPSFSGLTVRHHASLSPKSYVSACITSVSSHRQRLWKLYLKKKKKEMRSNLHPSIFITIFSISFIASLQTIWQSDASEKSDRLLTSQVGRFALNVSSMNASLQSSLLEQYRTVWR